MSDKIWLGQKAASLESAPSFAPYTGVTIWYDDENAYQAGDKTGRVLEIDCPWATQEMANNILASVQGYSYRPYEAQDAILDPAAELGDGITVGGLYSQIAGLNDTFNSLYLANVSAPSDEEVDHEYPYISSLERQMARKVTLGKDYFGVRISKASGLEITKTDTEGNKKSRMKLNSDLLAFYNDDGSEALYFDTNAGKFKFAGDVAVTGGTMNINNKFIVDENGNLTLNGNINLSGGSITWGPNAPSSGVSASQVRTIINERLVASPTIAGGKFCSLGQEVYIAMSSDAGAGSEYGSMKMFLSSDNSLTPFEIRSRVNYSSGSTELALYAFDNLIFNVDGNSGEVSGLYLRFS